MIVTKRMTNVLLSCDALNSLIVALRGHLNLDQLRDQSSCWLYSMSLTIAQRPSKCSFGAASH